MIYSGDIKPDIEATTYRWAVGYALGTLVGVPIGIAFGLSKRLYESMEFLLDFFRSLPVTAIFPLFLLAFGIGNNSKIAMVFSAVIFVIILNSAYGIQHATKTRIRMAKSFGASNWQVFRMIVFFEALPGTLVGLRVALSLSLVVVIVSEMFIGTNLGIGQRIFDSYSTNSVSDLYALILFIGIIGYFLNKMFVFFEQKVVFWAGK
ncbi:MAG: ABC transporter permease [Nitrospirae bacterium]|nr:ABC transporter permease [Nitrospirota bacterium]